MWSAWFHGRRHGRLMSGLAPLPKIRSMLKAESQNYWPPRRVFTSFRPSHSWGLYRSQSGGELTGLFPVAKVGTEPGQRILSGCDLCGTNANRGTLFSISINE